MLAQGIRFSEIRGRNSRWSAATGRRRCCC